MKTLLQKLAPTPLLKLYRDFKNRQLVRKFEGDQVLCCICKSTFSEFAPHGIKSRKNARCLNCNSLERHRLLWKYLQDKTDLFNAEKSFEMLHFAPEQMFYDRFSEAPNISYNPCDLFPKRYDFGGKVKVKKVDITKIPHPDNFFDVILCNHVLEHIPDDALAMSELFRVLKKGGWAILMVPFDSKREKTYEDFSITSEEGRLKAFGQKDHVRLYGKDYKDRLANAGFTVKEDTFVKSFSKEDQFHFGFKDAHFIHLCLK